MVSEYLVDVIVTYVVSFLCFLFAILAIVFFSKLVLYIDHNPFVPHPAKKTKISMQLSQSIYQYPYYYIRIIHKLFARNNTLLCGEEIFCEIWEKDMRF